MEKKSLYRILEIVQKNGDIRQLIHEGLDYKEIGELTKETLENGYLIYENRKIVLTAKGVKTLEDNGKNFKKINKEEWIKPELKSKTIKLNKNDIFLPKQDELSF